MRIGFLGLLALLFIGLKLGGVISWSWWAVTSPLWLGYAIVLVIWLFCFLGMCVAAGTRR